MAEVTAAQCFEDADENHDGVVSFHEFKTWFDQPEGVQAVYVDGEDERTSQEAQEIEAFRATSDPPKSKSRTEILERVFAAEEMLLSLKAELANMGGEVHASRGATETTKRQKKLKGKSGLRAPRASSSLRGMQIFLVTASIGFSSQSGVIFFFSHYTAFALAFLIDNTL